MSIQPGDINGDNNAGTGADLVYFASHIANLPGYRRIPPSRSSDGADLNVADLNLDGQVGAADLVYLASHIAGLDGYNLPQPEPEPEPTQYRLTMVDSYDDGWNGGTWTATNQDTQESFGPYTITNGSQAIETFVALDGTYNIVCGGGSYDSEMSWILTNDSTNVSLNGVASNYIIELPSMEDNSPEPPDPEEPINTIYINIAFHMIDSSNTWTSGQNNMIQAQLDVLNAMYSTTTQSMLWDPSVSEEDQPYSEATFGGKDMKIQFQLLTGPESNGNKYYTLIHPNHPSGNWNSAWLNGDNILGSGLNNASGAYGVDYNGSQTTTLNTFWSEADNGLLGYAAFPYGGTFGTEEWGCWNLTSSMPGNSGVYGGGKTLAHEIGHNLGLYHTFEPDKDYTGGVINDTPYHTASSGGSFVDLSGNPYPNDSPLIPDTNTDYPGRDPVYNIMNYSYDDSLFRFTDDQVFRMWVAIQENMTALWASAGNKTHKLVNNSNSNNKIINKDSLMIHYENKDQLFYHKHDKKCGCKHPLFFNPSKAKGKNREIYNLLLKEEKINDTIKKLKEKSKSKSK
jgi:hypothetical protein